MAWGIVTVNDVTGNDVTGNDVTGSKVTRSCIAKNAVTGTGNVREIISNTRFEVDDRWDSNIERVTIGCF
jgi:hypothetical protein